MKVSYDGLNNVDNNRGFTMIEFLVALAVGSIVSAVIYMAFTFQQQSWVTQDQLATMQQNLRMSLRFVAKDLMLAGYDPQFSGLPNFVAINANGVSATNNTSVEFTMDLANDAGSMAVGSSDGDIDDPGEHISYYLQDNQLCRDDINAGISCDVVAQNIERLLFFYIKEDGTVEANPPAGTLNDIRLVRAVILARTNAVITNYTGSQTFVYIDQNGVNISETFNDNRRRLLLAMNVNCRNKGL